MDRTKSEKKMPKILVLKPITPSADSARAERLRYDNLEQLVDEYRPFEFHRWNKVLEAEPDSLDEAEAARKLAMLYLLMGSVALQRAETNESIERWSERYTQGSAEIYGLPEPEIARVLEANRVEGLDLVDMFEQAEEKLGGYLEERYCDVFDALDLDNAPDYLAPEEAAERFKAGIDVLTENYDPAWGRWTIKLDNTKDSVSVEQQTETFIVGTNRANIANSRIKTTFAHEVLVHMQRAINGAKRSEKMRTGLPGYLDAEEGLGVFVEYAVGGFLKDEVVDRYVDIAWALGQIDGIKHTRQEMIIRARNRALDRPTSWNKSPENLEKEVYAHVNRIYRGTRGDETVGVFTKDISYFKGFVDIGRYIETRLESGDDIGEIFEYLIQGKFDPNNPAHVDYVEKQ